MAFSASPMTPLSVYWLVHSINPIGPLANRSPQINFEFRLFVLEISLLILFWRTLFGERWSNIEVSSSPACEQPPGKTLSLHCLSKSGFTFNNCHQLQKTQLASVSTIVRRATMSMRLWFEPCPLMRIIFLNPW